jgi:adenylate cyclase
MGPRAATITFAAFVGLIVLSGLLDPWLASRAEPLPEPIIRLFFVLDLLGVAFVTFLVLIYFVRQRQRTLDELGDEQLRSEGLLRNILPAEVAERLKDGEGVIADRYEAVTVLFADVVGFTALAQRLSAEDLVVLLDRVFRELDALSERYGLEKIKTVGDAYMVVAGAPDPLAHHPQAAAEMALGMLGALIGAEWPTGDPMQLRIGVATGPVVAGVIGRDRYAYDLWGDTVNLASRLEASSEPGRILVSIETYERLKEQYRFSDSHVVFLKGKGPTPARFLLGRSGKALESLMER